MSRVLAQLLGTDEPGFHLQLRQLERAAGQPSADVRLGEQIRQATRQKIFELGLDPDDTTARELYGVLQTKLSRDEVTLNVALNVRADLAQADILMRLADQLSQLCTSSKLYVVKSSVMKQMLKKLKPKATMKRLGYRSMDSMFKHEPVAQILAASQVSESLEWHRARVNAYGKLEAKDFEYRSAQFLVPTHKTWPGLAIEISGKRHSNMVELAETGSIVLLPIQQVLPGLAITTFTVAVHALNHMRGLSVYLKMQQFQPSFGQRFQSAMLGEPVTDVTLEGSKLGWRMVHWLYSNGHVPYRAELFDPYVLPDDLVWHTSGDILSELDPRLAFWYKTDSLGFLSAGEMVSLNLHDVALGVCNGLRFAERVVHNAQENLRRELFACYLHHQNLQTTLHAGLSNQFAVPALD